jgi:hypothetical protein
MSQINDALKRAQDIQTKNILSSVPPMLPVESKSGQPVANLIWPAAIILFLLLFAGLFIAVSSGHHAATKIDNDPAPVTAPVVHSAPAPNPPVVAPVTETLAANTQKTLQIQGIVSDPVHPYAIISGKTVYVGDAVNGQRVAAISPDTLTLVGNGQTNRLRIGAR